MWCCGSSGMIQRASSSLDFLCISYAFLLDFLCMFIHSASPMWCCGSVGIIRVRLFPMDSLWCLQSKSSIRLVECACFRVLSECMCAQSAHVPCSMYHVPCTMYHVPCAMYLVWCWLVACCSATPATSHQMYLYWISGGSLLDLHWISAGSLLDLYWICTGSL